MLLYEVSIYSHIIGIMSYEDALQIKKHNSAICIVSINELLPKQTHVSLHGNVYQCIHNECDLGQMSYELALKLRSINTNFEFYPCYDLTDLKETYERDVIHFGPGISWEWEDLVEEFYDELISLGQNPDDYLDIRGGFQNCYEAYLNRLYEEEFLK